MHEVLSRGCADFAPLDRPEMFKTESGLACGKVKDSEESISSVIYQEYVSMQGNARYHHVSCTVLKKNVTNSDKLLFKGEPHPAAPKPKAESSDSSAHAISFAGLELVQRPGAMNWMWTDGFPDTVAR